LAGVTVLTFELSTEVCHMLGTPAELKYSEIPKGATVNSFYRSLITDTQKTFNFFMTIMTELVRARLIGLQSGIVSTWCLLVFKAVLKQRVPGDRLLCWILDTIALMANLQIGAQEALTQYDLQRAVALTGFVYALLSVVASEVAAQREGSTALMRARNPGASTVNPYLQTQIPRSSKK
jgi:hypothetical protein